VIWVGKNLVEKDVISCIYDAHDVGKVRSATALAYATADEGCYSLYVPGRGETPPSSKCTTRVCQ